MPLVFVLSGDGADKACAAFGAIVASFEPGCDIVAVPKARLSAGARKAVDPIALATLILSIPSALLAVIDIADRIEKRRRAQKMIDEAQRLRVENAVEVHIIIDEAPKPLADLTPDAFLAAAQKDQSPLE